MENVTPKNQESAALNKGKRKYTKKSKPRGRPRLNDDKKHKYPAQVYFDKETIEGLTAICENENRSMSSVVNEFVVKGGYKEPLTEEQTMLLRSLYNLANNLNQLAKKANTYGMFSELAEQNTKLANEISDLIVKLNETI